MERRLILLRHAKSSWKSAAVTDHERPLNKRGRRDAPRVARRLVELGWQPEWVVSSDSARTRETFELMKDELDGEVPVHFVEQLYSAGLTELRAELARIPDAVGCVLALGHNPGWEAAASRLSGSAVIMKTATAVLLEGSGNTWADALDEKRPWTLQEIIRPREL